MSDFATRKIVDLSPEVRTDLAQAIYAGVVAAGRSAAKKVILVALTAVIVLPLFSWLSFKAGFLTDETDGTSRSGMALYIDAGTGCQYLAVSGSGITPRMDKDGYQVCKGGK
ncbi:hypothetical protein FHU10_1222 [Serratia fonticola]|uniref:DUF6440 domain-containing protein n=1 Tax=Serratia fonticola TaxID=47917 RepID=A0A559T2C8_SERFO|nr:DUF6440 family protein [Serratia fonticola]TQI78737.1 hypothetical protein FHU09_1229 [Serratia fonticola]TQI99241.1 hypothetical protein FHU11_4823 [Serratia fonticola]TVZ68766.1 hypothetical protein FHU10_1222 [Serratia fonticola]